MSANPTRRGSPPITQRIAAMATTILKLEAELANVKSVMLQMSARMLRLELAVSTLDKDGALNAILKPEQF